MKERIISFAKLSIEEIETCWTLEFLHEKGKDCKCVTHFCECEKLIEHDTLNQKARKAYQQDAHMVIKGHAVFSIHLQKVTMLLAMPRIKVVCFTKFKIVFHQTIFPINLQKSVQTKSIMWLEGIHGQLGEEIASSYLVELNLDWDHQNVTYSMDTCTA